MAESLDRFHHVGIVVQDLETSIAWYGQHLGFARVSDYAFPGVKAVFIERGNARLELFQTDGSKPMEAGRQQPATNLQLGGINHFAIEVDDLDQTLADLSAKGVEIVSPAREVPDGRGYRFAFIRDNESMLIELLQASASAA